MWAVLSSLESYCILSSTNNGNQNLHTGYPVGHTGLFFSDVAYLGYDVSSKDVLET
jgi:hypothetical protein